ncbi:MAG: FAD-binding protein [Chloroflexi bacterium]|nr:FAD-binding protein [Chloroflexota bacterium]
MRNKSRLVHELERLLGPRSVLFQDQDLALYEYDGSIERGRPDLVVFPRTAENVSAIVKIANREGLPFQPRGAGTGLSGGTVADQGGITIAMSRMKQIEIDAPNLRAIVQPGVVNHDLSIAAAPFGLYYVPDPSSQKACSIGGNVAENAGGPHCLAYGVTTNHVLGLQVVLPDGEIIETGGAALDTPGYDLTGLFVGSEGTLGIVTQIIVRLVPLPEAVRTLLAVFPSVETASNAVSAVIAAGNEPAAMEMMDNTAIQAVEAAKHAGYPLDAGAVLLIDVEGVREGLDELVAQISDICRAEGAYEIRIPQMAEEREKLWSGRKGAFGAMGRLAPSYYVQDGVVPRTQVPAILRKIGEIAQKYEVRIANVFHAGDGNLHPLILFDERDELLTQRVIQAGNEIIRECINVGGSITGEHGVGIEKRDLMALMFSPVDLQVMARIKALFNPDNRLNPCKLLPATKSCIEVSAKRRAAMRKPLAVGARELESIGGLPIP